MRFESSRIPELDGLRGIAILLVIAFHGFLLAPIPSAIAARLMLFGWSGVDLFFVLSGFLIGGILIDSQDSPRYYLPFYARRFFRIVPIYFAVLAVYAALFYAGGATKANLVESAGPPMPWWVYLTFTNNLWIAKTGAMGVFLAVSWSLAIEEQFYLTLPFVMRVVGPRRMYVLVPFAIAAVAALRIMLCSTREVTQIQGYVLPFMRADALGIGVFCALLVRSDVVMDFLQRRKWTLYVAIAIFALVIVWTGGALPNPVDGAAAPIMTYGLTVVALFYASVMLLAIAHPSSIGIGFFRLKPLKFMGKISYFVYLGHFAAMAGVNSVVLDYTPNAAARWAAMLTALLLLFTVAQISWTFFESRMVKIGHRFKYRPKVIKELQPTPVAVADDQAAA